MYGIREDYFTVRDRADTDQGRHGPGRVHPSAPGGRKGDTAG